MSRGPDRANGGCLCFVFRPEDDLPAVVACLMLSHKLPHDVLALDYQLSQLGGAGRMPPLKAVGKLLASLTTPLPRLQRLRIALWRGETLADVSGAMTVIEVLLPQLHELSVLAAPQDLQLLVPVIGSKGKQLESLELLDDNTHWVPESKPWAQAACATFQTLLTDLPQLKHVKLHAAVARPPGIGVKDALDIVYRNMAIRSLAWAGSESDDVGHLLIASCLDRNDPTHTPTHLLQEAQNVALLLFQAKLLPGLEVSARLGQFIHDVALHDPITTRSVFSLISPKFRQFLDDKRDNKSWLTLVEHFMLPEVVNRTMDRMLKGPCLKYLVSGFQALKTHLKDVPAEDHPQIFKLLADAMNACVRLPQEPPVSQAPFDRARMPPCVTYAREWLASKDKVDISNRESFAGNEARLFERIRAGLTELIEGICAYLLEQGLGAPDVDRLRLEQFASVRECCILPLMDSCYCNAFGIAGPMTPPEHQ